MHVDARPIYLETLPRLRAVSPSINVYVREHLSDRFFRRFKIYLDKAYSSGTSPTEENMLFSSFP